eukprot:6174380-Pleurochrysis_carterae.AAC.1
MRRCCSTSRSGSTTATRGRSHTLSLSKHSGARTCGGCLCRSSGVEGSRQTGFRHCRDTDSTKIESVSEAACEGEKSESETARRRGSLKRLFFAKLFPRLLVASKRTSYSSHRSLPCRYLARCVAHASVAHASLAHSACARVAGCRTARRPMMGAASRLNRALPAGSNAPSYALCMPSQPDPARFRLSAHSAALPLCP